MRVLFGNELGGGFGHVSRLIEFEAALRRLVPDLESRLVLRSDSATVAEKGFGGAVFSPPVLDYGTLHRGYKSPYVERRMAALLLRGGDALTPRLAFWLQEIRSFRPDLIVVDLAPSLALAARGRVPCVVVGIGYSLPPGETDTCIPFRKAMAGDAPEHEDDAFWLERLNPVLEHNGIAPLEVLPHINRADYCAIFTIAMFDPFWRHRHGGYLGPVHPGGSPRPAQVMGENIVAYFSMDSHINHLVEGLKLSGLPVTAFLPGGEERLRKLVADSNITLVHDRFLLSRDLPSCGLTIHAGSLGMCSASLYAGVPQVALYQQQEAMMNGRAVRLSATGSASPLSATSAADIAQMIREAYRNPDMRGFAVALSERYKSYRDSDPMDEAARQTLRLLA